MRHTLTSPLPRQFVCSKGIHLFWLSTRCLKDSRESASPCRPACNLASVGVDGIPIMLTAASVEIDVGKSDPAFALPDIADSPEEEDDGESEIGLEETFSIVKVAGERRSDSDEELCCQGDDDEEDADP